MSRVVLFILGTFLLWRDRLIRAQFAPNMDTAVDEIIKEYFPRYHQPPLRNNTVYIAADLYNIVSVDEVSETITTKLWLYLAYLINIPEEVWNTKLPWVYRFFPGKNRIWKPDVIILNNVETISTNGADPVVMRYDCLCSEEECAYCGSLVVFPSATTETTSCSFDVTNFPFDIQECKINIGPWITDTTSIPRFYDHLGQERGPYRLSIRNEDNRMSLAAYEESSQWDLLEVTVVNKTRKAVTDVPNDYDYLEYTLRMKRKPHFFVYTIILPCLCLTLLAVLSIYIPVESGEKIGLGVTLLLAQVVNLLILSSLLPASSQFFPQLGFYFLGTIVLISISLVYNAIIINVYYHGYLDVINFLKRKRKSNVKQIFPQASTQNEMFEMMKEKKRNSGEKPHNSSIESTTDDSSEDEDESRKKRCRIADHVFAVIIFLAILILHAIYFAPFM